MNNERSSDDMPAERSGQATSLYVPIVIFMLITSITGAGWYTSEKERSELRAEISELKRALAADRHDGDQQVERVKPKDR